MERTIYTKYSNKRVKEYRIRTDIVLGSDEKKYVKKTPLCPEGANHINNIYSNFGVLKSDLEGGFIEPVSCYRKDNSVVFPFIEGENLGRIVIQCLQVGNIEGFERWVFYFISEIERLYKKEPFVETEGFIKFFGKNVFQGELWGARNINIDMIFENLFLEEDKWVMIDYEWVFDFLIPLNYVIYRCVHQLFLNVERDDEQYEKNLLTRIGIDEDQIRIYRDMEAFFQKKIVGNAASVDEETVAWAMNNLMSLDEKKKMSAQIFFDFSQGYSEENSYRILYHSHDDGVEKIKIDIPSKCVAVRIDPCDEACLLDIVDLYGLCGADIIKLSYRVNGKSIHTKIVDFWKEDPNVEIDLRGAMADTVIIEYRIVGNISNLLMDMNADIERKEYETDKIIRDLNEKIDLKEHELATTSEQLQLVTIEREQKNEELQRVYNSRGWKMIQSLRRIRQLLRRSQ